MDTEEVNETGFSVYSINLSYNTGVTKALCIWQCSILSYNTTLLHITGVNPHKSIILH